MRRKVFLVATVVAVVGLLFWWQQPQHAPVHENAQAGAPASNRSSVPVASSSDRESLETPPPLALPDAAYEGREQRMARDAVSPRYPVFLPKEAIATLRLIERGGPYPYRQDDGVFQNRERKLPMQPRGYYREYTVKTPGSRDRGARRVVAGGQPPVEFFYTDDHYRSFRRFTLDGATERDDTAVRTR
jgi:ribonuclease T1